MKRHILIVEDNITNLKAAEKILKPYYRVTLLISGAQTLKFLKRDKPDLILLGIDMINMDGYETINAIRQYSEFKEIPIIITSDIINAQVEMNFIESGAVDFLRKPFVTGLMINRIKLHLDSMNYKEELELKVAEKTEIIERLQDVMILSLAELVECRDENTGGHVKRTATYVEILTVGMMERGVYIDILTEEYAQDMIRSAPLHDVGKIGINDATLLKNGSLDQDEFEYMKEHTTLGAKALQKMIDETSDESFLYIAKDIAYYHHEKWDGKGYPKGLKGEEIPLCARIMAIGDVYDALTTARSYKKAFSHEEAVEIILFGKGTNFDPIIVDVFESIHSKFELARALL